MVPFDIPVPVLNPFSKLEGYNCFGCSPHNPAGLHMHFMLEGDEVTCTWEPEPNLQGWLNTLHGGIQATLMDEIASWLVFVKLQTAGVTSRMEVKLLRPVRTDSGALKIRARLKEMKRNIAVVETVIHLPDGTPGAEALMYYYTFPEQTAREKHMYPGIENFLPASSPTETA